jgi:DNA repair protein RadC
MKITQGNEEAKVKRVTKPKQTKTPKEPKKENLVKAAIDVTDSHYDGHRERVRAKFLKTANVSSYQPYELLEILLFYCNKRSDVKPLAKYISSYFKDSISSLLNAKHSELELIKGVGDNFLCLLKLVKELQSRNLFEKANETTKINHFDDLVNYLKVFYNQQDKEIFKVLFLDAKNNIIADEVMSEGTTNQAVVYPREIVKKCLQHHTTHVVLSHNHPSGDPTPSKADIEITQNIQKALATIDVSLLDHIIIAKNTTYSFRMDGKI